MVRKAQVRLRGNAGHVASHTIRGLLGDTNWLGRSRLRRMASAAARIVESIVFLELPVGVVASQTGKTSALEKTCTLAQINRLVPHIPCHVKVCADSRRRWLAMAVPAEAIEIGSGHASGVLNQFPGFPDFTGACCRAM